MCGLQQDAESYSYFILKVFRDEYKYRTNSSFDLMVLETLEVRKIGSVSVNV